MTRTENDQLELVVRLRQSTERRAAVRLGELETDRRRQAGLRAELETFQREYQAGMARALSVGVSAQHLHEMLRIVGQTRAVLGFQQQAHSNAETAHNLGREQWQRASRAYEAVVDLSKRRHREQLRVRERRAQDAADDVSQGRAIRAMKELARI